MKRLIIAALALAMSACSPATTGLSSAPAPLAETAIEEKGITLAWASFDTALDAINALRRAGMIKDGSLLANGLAELIDKTTLALAAASAAQRASNTTNYITAMREAETALIGIRDLLKGY